MRLRPAVVSLQKAVKTTAQSFAVVGGEESLCCKNVENKSFSRENSRISKMKRAARLQGALDGNFYHRAIHSSAGALPSVGVCNIEMSFRHELLTTAWRSMSFCFESRV